MAEDLDHAPQVIPQWFITAVLLIGLANLAATGWLIMQRDKPVDLAALDAAYKSAESSHALDASCDIARRGQMAALEQQVDQMTSVIWNERKIGSCDLRR